MKGLLLNGTVVPVHKEEDWTSHDAIQKLRSILGIQEVGHAGSLDPFATGVLVCGAGRGTKVLSYLMDLPKDYVGLMRLGRITDTGDRTGIKVEERPVGTVDLGRAREIAATFIGVQEQIPPMVSALKHQGRRLYELAREGIQVERKPRIVEIRSFDILGISEDLLEFRVLCGKGTYVRSLAQDFGDRLGPGATLEELRRRAVGSFTDEQAVSLTADPDQVREALSAASRPLADALEHLPALRLQADWVRRVRQGGQPPWRAVDVTELPRGEHFRLLGPEGELVALAALDAIPGPADRSWRDGWELKLERVL